MLISKLEKIRSQKEALAKVWLKNGEILTKPANKNLFKWFKKINRDFSMKKSSFLNLAISIWKMGLEVLKFLKKNLKKELMLKLLTPNKIILNLRSIKVYFLIILKKIVLMLKLHNFRIRIH